MRVNSIYDIAGLFPPIKGDFRPLQRMLYNIGVPLEANRWVTFSLFIGLLLLIISYSLSESLIIAILISIGAFAFTFYLPFIEERKMETIMESELPTFLRDMGTLLSMQIPFIEALDMVSKRKSVIGNELKKAIREIKRGTSIPAALSTIAERLNSNVLKRAFAQVIATYEHGGGSQELKRAGDDLLNTQRYRLKEYVSKSSIFGLLFIMFSVVGPTFYIIMSIVGAIMFDTSIDIHTMQLVLLIILPSISYMILLISTAMMPPTLSKSSKQSSKAIILGITNAIVFLLPLEISIKIAIAALTFIGSILLFMKQYLEMKRIEEIEKQLPNALLIISSMPKGTTPEEMFRKIAKANLGAISEEFKKALNQLEANVNINIVLSDLVSRVKSAMFEKVIETINYSLKAGGNISRKVAELADDLLLFFEVNKEKAAILSMQKYTLLVGVILMPITLSISINLIKSMSGVMNVSINFEEIIYSLLPAYMLLNSGIVSSFSASIEGKASKELIYFSALSAISITTFFILMGGII